VTWGYTFDEYQHDGAYELQKAACVMLAECWCEPGGSTGRTLPFLAVCWYRLGPDHLLRKLTHLGCEAAAPDGVEISFNVRGTLMVRFGTDIADGPCIDCRPLHSSVATP